MPDIDNLVISYPDFQLNTQIDPEQFDTNNLEITTKVNDIVDKLHSIEIDDSGAHEVKTSQIGNRSGGNVHDVLVELDGHINANSLNISSNEQRISDAEIDIENAFINITDLDTRQGTHEAVVSNQIVTGDNALNNRVTTELATIKNDLTTNNTSYNNRLTEIKNQFNSIVALGGNPSGELVASRGTFGSLNQRLDSVDTSLAEIPTQYEALAQSSRPPKQGIVTSSNKIIYKVSDTEYRVIQVANKQCLLYVLKKGNGGSSGTDTGGTWDLMRVQQVTQVADAFVYWWDVPVSGAVTEVIAPSVTSAYDSALANTNGVDSTRVFSSQDQLGLGLYDIATGVRADWNINSRGKRKITITLACDVTSSDNVEVYLNDILTKTIDLTKLNSNLAGSEYVTIDVPMPFSKSTKVWKVGLKNVGTGKARIICFNFALLKDYDENQIAINNFKVFPMPLANDFINGSGSSDYAFHDLTTNKWIGSYHGGETLISGVCTYNDNLGLSYIYNDNRKDMSLIATNAWWVSKEFTMSQITDLSGKARMISTWDFGIDGTLEMKFNISNNLLLTDYFYTALTITRPTFDYVSYPKFVLVADNLDTNFNMDLSGIVDGMVAQYNSAQRLELVSRFTQFSTGYNNFPNQIWSQPSYNKHYYGIVRGYTTGIVIPNLTWSKGLDFIIK